MMALMDALKCNNNENEKNKNWMNVMNDIKHTLKLGHERMFCRKDCYMWKNHTEINLKYEKYMNFVII